MLLRKLPDMGFIENYEIDAKSNLVSERKIATWCFAFSLCVIAAKVYASNSDYLRDLVMEKKLVTYESVSEHGEVMMRHVWEEGVRHSGLWLPVLCGFLATYFTWTMVYLDSNVPGIQPPSPLSPNKNKQLSGHRFQLNYIFALIVGVTVTVYMYTKDIQIGS